MNLIETFSNLPSAAKGALGLFGVFSALTGYLVFDTIVRPPKSMSVYNVENEIDQSLLPILDDPSAPPAKNQGALVFPSWGEASGQTCNPSEALSDCKTETTTENATGKPVSEVASKTTPKSDSKKPVALRKKRTVPKKSKNKSAKAPTRKSVATATPAANAGRNSETVSSGRVESRTPGQKISSANSSIAEGQNTNRKSSSARSNKVENQNAGRKTKVATSSKTEGRGADSKTPVASTADAMIQTPSTPRKTIILPAIRTIKEPARRRRDPNRAKARRFNKKRRGFSTVSYSPAIAVKEQKPAKDKNLSKKWPVKGNANTYPTDLSRVITKEKFIFATLNNRIVSSFSGRVLLTISQNIYGSHGAKVLIPIGTKASGSYKAIEEIGVERLSIHVERMVTPDGQLILLKKSSTIADQQGATGIKGEIDNKYLEKFGLPLAFSIANNTTTLMFQKLVDSVSGAEDDASALARIFNEQWSKDQSATNREIIGDIIKNNINIMPTMTIEPGQQLLLYLEHDIFFKPNKNGVTEVVKNFNR